MFTKALDIDGPVGGLGADDGGDEGYRGGGVTLTSSVRTEVRRQREAGFIFRKAIILFGTLGHLRRLRH